MKQTNNRGEYLALIEGYEVASKINENATVIVYTDSKLLVNTVTEWIPTWKRNDWRKKGGNIENLDLVKKIDDIINNGKSPLQIFHVSAHTGGTDFFSTWNAEADRLAVEALN